jgi:cell division protein ZapA (FtsZ GTPase activity inhibitor)
MYIHIYVTILFLRNIKRYKKTLLLQDRKVIGAILICMDIYGLKNKHEIAIAEKYSYNIKRYTTIFTSKIIISACHKT